MSIFLLFFPSFFVCLSTASRLADVLSSEEYDGTMRPSPLVTVTLQLSVFTLVDVEARLNRFSVGFYLREAWKDARLADANDESAFLTVLRDAKLLWMPDVTPLSVIKCDTHREIVEVDGKTGDVFRSRAMFCALDFNFDLSEFPFDAQALRMDFQPFGLDVERLVLAWDEEPLSPLPQDTVVNAFWRVDGANTSTSVHNWRRGTDFSRASASIVVKRRISQYFVRILFPLWLLVLLATCQYWIDKASTPARVGFALTMTLTVITFNVVVSNELPKVGYLSILDVWVMCALMITGCGVVEYSFVGFCAVQRRKTGKAFWDAIAQAIEVFCRGFFPTTWITITLLIFLPKPGSTVAMVVIIAAAGVFALFFAKRSFHIVMREARIVQQDNTNVELLAKEAAEEPKKGARKRRSTGK